MKKLGYLLGLMAMVVMMAMTSCKKDGSSADISPDVQTVCDLFDDLTSEIENAEDITVFLNISQSLLNLDPDIDEQTELTDDDKDALKESFMSFATTLMNKTAEFVPQEISGLDVDEKLQEAEQELNEILEQSVTLGDFLDKIDL